MAKREQRETQLVRNILQRLRRHLSCGGHNAPIGKENAKANR